MILKNLNFGLLKQQFQRIPESMRSVLVLSLLLLFIGIVKYITKPKEATLDKRTQIDSTIDTVIPKGFVLVPVQISNIEAITPLVSANAVVDLYKFNDKGSATKIAQKVRVIRAPYNPNVYAVLVHETESDTLMKYSGPFYAAIQNQKVTGGSIVSNTQTNKKISISYSP